MSFIRFTIVFILATSTLALAIEPSAENSLPPEISKKAWAHLTANALLRLPKGSDFDERLSAYWEDAYAEELLALEKIQKLENRFNSASDAEKKLVAEQIKALNAAVLKLRAAVTVRKERSTNPLEFYANAMFDEIKLHPAYADFAQKRWSIESAEKSLYELSKEAARLIEELHVLKRRLGVGMDPDIASAVSSKMHALQVNAMASLMILTSENLTSDLSYRAQTEQRAVDANRDSKKQRIVDFAMSVAAVSEIAAAVYLQVGQDAPLAVTLTPAVLGAGTLINFLTRSLWDNDRFMNDKTDLVETALLFLCHPIGLMYLAFQAIKVGPVAAISLSALPNKMLGLGVFNLKQLVLRIVGKLPKTRPVTEEAVREELAQKYLAVFSEVVGFKPEHPTLQKIEQLAKYLFYTDDREMLEIDLPEITELKRLRCSAVLTRT